MLRRPAQFLLCLGSISQQEILSRHSHKATSDTVSFINHQAVTAGNDGQQNELPASMSLQEVNKIVTKPSAMAAMKHTPI